MKAVNIESLRKKYRNEWLLIAVDTINERATLPLSGWLLAHSPRCKDIDRKSLKYKKPAVIVYSEDKFPKGYAAAF